MLYNITKYAIVNSNKYKVIYQKVIMFYLTQTQNNTCVLST